MDIVTCAGRDHGDVVIGAQPFGQMAAMRLGAAREVGAVAVDHEGKLHGSGDVSDAAARGTGAMRSTSRRSSAFWMASSCTHAASTWFMRCCRTKLSWVYSKSHRSAGISSRRLMPPMTDAASWP